MKSFAILFTCTYKYNSALKCLKNYLEQYANKKIKWGARWNFANE
ncbi:hypothetical protein [Spiroplasma endosymbiont of Tipula paludosa]